MAPSLSSPCVTLHTMIADRALGQQWSAFPENASAADVMWQAGRITEEGLTLKEVPAREGALTVDLWHR